MGLVSNPYPAAKDHQSINTVCELCDRTIKTKDWSAHKRSRKHRELEQKEREGEAKKQALPTGDGFSDNTSGFNNDAGTAGDWGDNAGTAGGWGDNAGTTGGWGDNAGTWGSGSGDASTGYGNDSLNSTGYSGHKAQSGGPGACYGCGEVGHNKRDCPSTGASRGCFNCGQQG